MSVLKKILYGTALAAVLGAPLLTPEPAQAWWARPGWGWGWHAGWGWRGGVFIGAPAIAVGVPPVYAAPPVYAPSPYRWVPGHYLPNGAYVPPHWGYY
jgi:hypothetical protein